MRNRYVSPLAWNNIKAFNYLPLTFLSNALLFSPSVAACNLLWLFLCSQSPIFLVCNKIAVRILQSCSCFSSWDSGIRKAIPCYHDKEITLGWSPLKKVGLLEFCLALCLLFPSDHFIFSLVMKLEWTFIYSNHSFGSPNCFAHTLLNVSDMF